MWPTKPTTLNLTNPKSSRNTSSLVEYQRKLATNEQTDDWTNKRTAGVIQKGLQKFKRTDAIKTSRTASGNDGKSVTRNYNRAYENFGNENQEDISEEMAKFKFHMTKKKARNIFLEQSSENDQWMNMSASLNNSNFNYAISNPFQYLVIYVQFGPVPDFLLYGIEMALMHNNYVVVISDEMFSITFATNSTRLFFLKMSDYISEADKFYGIYRHLSPFQSWTTAVHEFNCLQRWFIVHQFMVKMNLSNIFFSDGDSVLFANISGIGWHRRNAGCKATINVESQIHDYVWVGAGEASIWSLEALSDFCRHEQVLCGNSIVIISCHSIHSGHPPLHYYRFIMHTYSKKLDALKKKTDSSVTDMSLLWLW